MNSAPTADQPLVRCEALSKEYPGGDGVRAVDDVSLEIRRGSTLGLVGESGSGKSTLGRLLLRLEEPTSGEVLFDGAPVTRARGSALRGYRRRVQVVLQDPYAALNPRRTVEQSVALPLTAQGLLPRRQRADRVRELLQKVGLDPSHAPVYPHELSGGQLQRVGIARALATSPEFIVLDEAVSALDVSIRAQILNLLIELQRELGLTYLFISHDLAIVRYMAPTIAVMYQGRIVEHGHRERLFAHPEHPYTRELLAAIPGQAAA
ncbi:MAG: ATP-binding cassette domain-containing protein [Solirubrobacterales bacterium]